VAEASGILALSPDRTGNVWTAQPAIPAEVTGKAGIARVHGLAAANGDDLIFGCDQGLCRWSRGTLRKWRAPSDLPADEWSGILLSKTGDLWIHGFAHTAVLPLGSEHFMVRELPRSSGNTVLPWIVEDVSGRILVNAGASVASLGTESLAAFYGRERAATCSVALIGRCRRHALDGSKRAWVIQMARL